MIEELFPITAPRFSVELIALERKDQVLATVRLVVRDEAGEIRDVKEQQIYLLQARHDNPRGHEFLRRLRARIAAMQVDAVEFLMPHDLFPTHILDADLPVDAMIRALDDPRSIQLLAVGKVAAIDPDRIAPPMLENRALEDESVVYADWLTERGDPRGELIAIALAREAADSEALRAREQKLLDEYAFEWLGRFAWAPPEEVTVTWRRGFLDTIRFGLEYVDRQPSNVDGEFEIRELARLPGTRFIRRVELLRKEFWDESVLQAIGDAGLPPNTRELVIATNDFQDAGDLSLAYPGMSMVRSFTVESRSFELGTIDLPALRTLELVTRCLSRTHLAALEPLHSLERLVLWLGEVGVHGCDVLLEDLQFEGFPQLRELGLCGRNPSAVLAHLLGTPVLAQLKVLEVVGGYLADADHEWLRDHASAFAHLDALHLPGTVVIPGVKVVPDDRFIPVYE